MDVHAVVGGAAEPVRQVQKRLGHATGDVGEDEVGDDVVGLAQTAGQLGEQPAGDARYPQFPEKDWVETDREVFDGFERVWLERVGFRQE